MKFSRDFLVPLWSQEAWGVTSDLLCLEATWSDVLLLCCCSKVAWCKGLGSSSTQLIFKDLPGKQDTSDNYFWSESFINNMPNTHAQQGREEKCHRGIKKISNKLDLLCEYSYLFPFSLTSKIFVQYNSFTNCVLPTLFIYCINHGFCYLFPYWLLWHDKVDAGP